MDANRWVKVMMVMMVVGGRRVEGQVADSTVCQDQPNNPGSRLPKLPESFSLRVEANILDKNKTTTLNEYFDHDANIAAVRQVEKGVMKYAFYMYNSNQFTRVVPDESGGNLCVAQSLSGTAESDIFGMKPINSSEDRVFSTSGALHFGDGINENYQGQETVRGIPCNKWLSCQYWQNMNATSNVVWYFSDPDTWTSISGFSVPVRCNVTGRIWTNGKPRDYQHIYEFYDFRDDITSASGNYFEVPKNTYCIGSNNTKPLPSMPTAYSFDSEILDIKTQSLSFIREEYDNVTNLLRLDYRDPPNINSPFHDHYVTQIHDYNTGVAYLIDVFRANCTTSLLAGADFDNEVTASGKLRLRNPNQFMDLNHNYVYQGVRTVRGVECDTWAAERTDYPIAGAQNPPSTWTLYFATANWMNKMGLRGKNLVLPVHLEIFSDFAVSPIHKHQSFYEYNVGEPDIMSWDISSCYDVKHSRTFAFLVTGRVQDLANGNVKVFKYYMVTNLMAALGMSPLRFAKMDVQEAGDDTLVSFDMLDKAPLTGNVANVPSEPSLDKAYSGLRDAVNSGQLKFLLFSNLNKVAVKPVGEKYQYLMTPAPNDKTITGGAMGGLAVGMLVLGVLVGFAVMFLVYKLRGGTFGGGDASMKRFDNDQERVVSDD